jgi:hypothetical protein
LNSKPGFQVRYQQEEASRAVSDKAGGELFVLEEE